jgi:hypothetical protein
MSCCGDGVLDPGEECDLGSQNDTFLRNYDKCNALCEWEIFMP